MMTVDAISPITAIWRSGRSQGVLLLNTVLTVRAHQANSHRGIGWEQFTDAAIQVLNEQDRPIVFLSLGTSGADEKNPC